MRNAHKPGQFRPDPKYYLICFLLQQDPIIKNNTLLILLLLRKIVPNINNYIIHSQIIFFNRHHANCWFSYYSTCFLFSPYSHFNVSRRSLNN
jgi:hypothetical protein